MKNSLALICLSTIAVVLISGCDDGLPNVGGIVTVNGAPVTNGNVTFHPTDGSRSGSGRIKPDGTYVISYRAIGDGMPPGEYKVAVVVDEFIPSNQLDSEEETYGSTIQNDGTLRHIVPKIYNRKETTPLTCTITEGGSYSQYDLKIETNAQ